MMTHFFGQNIAIHWKVERNVKEHVFCSFFRLFSRYVLWSGTHAGPSVPRLGAFTTLQCTRWVVGLMKNLEFWRKHKNHCSFFNIRYDNIVARFREPSISYKLRGIRCLSAVSKYKTFHETSVHQMHIISRIKNLQTSSQEFANIPWDILSDEGWKHWLHVESVRSHAQSGEKVHEASHVQLIRVLYLLYTCILLTRTHIVLLLSYFR